MAESDQNQLIVGIALTGSHRSKNVVKWAVEKFLPEGDVTFKLIHVYPKINAVPAPMGTWVAASQVREDILTDYKQQVQWNKQKKLIPHQKKLNAQKIKADIVLLESDDIPMALSMETATQSIRHLVIGSTSTSIFSMKNLSLTKEGDISQVISENAPSFCSVYVIGSDAKLQQLRPADSVAGVITIDDTSQLSKSKPSSPRNKSSAAASDSSYSFIQHGPVALAREIVELEHYAFKNTYFDSCNVSVGSNNSSSEDSEPFVAAHSSASSFIGTPSQSSYVGTLLPTASYVGTPPTGFFMTTPPAVSPVGTPPAGSYPTTPPTISRAGTPKGSSYANTPPAVSCTGTPTGGSYGGTPPTMSHTTGGLYVGNPLAAVSRAGTPTIVSYVDTPPTVSFLGTPSSFETGASRSEKTELGKLRTELKHIEKMYEFSQSSAVDERFLFPLDQLNEIRKQRLEEASKLKKKKDKELERIKKNNLKATQDEVIDKGEKIEKNKPQKKADTKAAEEAEEINNKLKGLFASPVVQFHKFTWEEIMEATSSLSDEFRIGMGAFGTVYKCKLHHTTVAIKVLHSKSSVINKQFVQELAILSRVRHPHLLLLLGAVPEKCCLVYEYMDYGSLDDRLFKKNGIPPLPWYDRFRICYEVASALAFLHNTTPRPIIHRDLKPANILLDHNLVSKIGDAGLGTMINVETASAFAQTMYKETIPAGTLDYIDPEYQRTGKVSTKSDIYALGVVILQLLTAKPAIGIARRVEDATSKGALAEILDPEAGEWPEKETLELALLGLQCALLSGRDRPNLRDKVLPVLERLTEVAGSARESASIPPHYFCPILKDMMEDPYVAADGYTYERSAIEKWLTDYDTSPTTNQPLPHKLLIPNTTLLDAITQWKSNNLTK